MLVSMAASRRVSATVRLMAVSIVPGDFFSEVPEAVKVRKRRLRAIVKALKARDGDTAERQSISMLAEGAEEDVRP